MYYCARGKTARQEAKVRKTCQPLAVTVAEKKDPAR